MKRFIAILACAIVLLSSAPSRATGWVTGTESDMRWLQQWDSWLMGYPVPASNWPAYCTRVKYQGCLGPWGPNGSWYGWTTYAYPVWELQTCTGEPPYQVCVGAGVWSYYLDAGFDSRVADLEISSASLDWEMLDDLALNTGCIPAPNWFVCPFTRVYFDGTQTQVGVVQTMQLLSAIATP
jgi:hypothetical protein